MVKKNNETDNPKIAAQQIDPDVDKKIGALWSQVRDSFGKAVKAMMALPRYRRPSIVNFQQVVKDGELRLHPIIARLVDKEVLERMGAAQRE